MKAARAAAVALALAALGVLAYVFARRVAWPYDLEWMEGGVLCHALRLRDHLPTYAPPSVDFVPFLYTPLYPALLAWLSHIFGLGYGVARALSLIGFGGALVLGYVFVRREGGSRAAALAAIGMTAAAFVPTGAWYDLARPDSLFLGLTTAGLLVGWWKRRSHAGGFAAAALLVLAFFTKQTASPFMIALGAALLVANWRVAITYGLSLAILGLPSLYWLNHSTDGWFWTYVFKLHQQHDFYAGRAFLGSPVRLLLLLGPALLLVPWALARRRSPGLVYAAWIGAAGAGAACLGFGTQWAFTNAFIPGIFFPSLAMGVAAGRLAGAGARGVQAIPIPSDATPPRRPAVVYALLAVSLALAPGALLPLVGRLAPREWAIDRTTPTGYDPRPYLPKKEDRARADALLARMRATDGEILIPFHPFYAHLAGKPTHLHRMGVLDVGRAGLGAPRGLPEAIRAHQFAAVVMDDKIDGNWQTWPGLLAAYRISDRVDGPRVVSGAETQPRYWLTPNPPGSVIEREP